MMRNVAPLAPVDRRTEFHQQLAELPASVFGFDPRIASAWFSDKYFQRTAQMAAAARRDPIVRMQVFAKQTGVVAGVYEVLRMFETQLAEHPMTKKKYCLRDFQIE